MKSQEQLKRDVAQAAVAYIRPLFGADAVIGVGTGSTADLFIDELAKYKHEFAGAVASSERSAARLREHGVRVLDLAETAKPLPVYVDGADEINPLLQMVKGGGGAHTREKIVAAASERFVCIVDETKCVDLLGAFAIPLEVIPMAVPIVMRKIAALGANATVRAGFVTDNGNPILDVAGMRLADAREMETTMNAIAGVVTCGLFALEPASVVMVAKQQGVDIRER
ncbi:MAG TPA: ribose-5-phosphate isomerase RpiA [Advenella sp.]|nr:ribose-5-phosphate isomerase RpiA [Advenella sp.]